jgi:phage terminase small subunit
MSRYAMDVVRFSVSAVPSNTKLNIKAQIMTVQNELSHGSLTPKQENFCLAYLETGNASEAYRRSYDAEKMSDATVNRSAKELMDNPKITARLEVLRKPAIEAAQITLTDHLNDLKRLRDLAEADGKFSAAVSAEMARGKASGLYTENLNVSGNLTGMPAITIAKYDNDTTN